MSSIFRSHPKHRPSLDEASTNTQRTSSSRIPTRPTTNSDCRARGKDTQDASRLAKRSSKIAAPPPKTERGKTENGRVHVSASAAQNAPSVSRRTSVKASEPSSAGPPTRSTSRSGNLAPPTTILRTPSLVSGSSASTFDSPRSNTLRRKPSTIDKLGASRHASTKTPDSSTDATMLRARADDDGFEDSVLGISFPPDSRYGTTTTCYAVEPKARIPDSVYAEVRQTHQDITSPAPGNASSTTLSTRYTDSPFSHVQTPSSASSYSSGIVTTTTSSSLTSNVRQQSPTRSRSLGSSRTDEKDMARRKGLPPVRESSTSSSNSTVKQMNPSVTPKNRVAQRSATSIPVSKTAEEPKRAPRSRLVKEPPRSKTTEIPPELAHLNVEPPIKSNQRSPPVRPSRDGTPTLDAVKQISPVVQSDLPSLATTMHKRTPSQETQTPGSISSPGFKSRFGMSSKSPSSQASPRVDSAISPPPAVRSFTRAETPDNTSADLPRLVRKDSPAAPAGLSPSKTSRFGFFNRKPKGETKKTAERPKRQATKGPAAGTGHEGYGRFATRTRSGSISSTNTTATSTTTTNNTSSQIGSRSLSSDSLASTQSARPSAKRKDSTNSRKDRDSSSELDDFLRERLNPVVLRGRGSISSNIASTTDTPAPVGKETSTTSSLGSKHGPQLLPSAISSESRVSPSKRPSTTRRMPSDSSEDDVKARYPTLADRRSITRLSQSDGKTDPKTLAPINTSLTNARPPLDSYDAEASAGPQTDTSVPITDDPFEGREGLWLQPLRSESPTKPARKWNFFSRARAMSPMGKGKQRVLPSTAKRSLDYAPRSPFHPLAHHAMVDPVESVGLSEVERMVHEATSPEESMSESTATSRKPSYDYRQSALLPSPPRPEHYKDSAFGYGARPTPRIMVRNDSLDSEDLPRVYRADSIDSALVSEPVTSPEQVASTNYHGSLSKETPRRVYTPDMTDLINQAVESQGNSPQRVPRLSPVGRIPQVVSKRDRERKISNNSFSRPFVQSQPKPNVKPPGSLYNQIRDLASPIETGSQPMSSTSTRSDGVHSELKSNSNTNPPSVSTNRTSMDINAGQEFFSFPAHKDLGSTYSSSSGSNSFMAALAASAPQMDDIWNEYDDLLDEVMLPHSTPLSTGSSLGAPFQYSSILYDHQSPRLSQMASWSPAPPRPPPQLPATQTSQPDSNVLSVPQQIARFMQPSMSPLTTPHVLSDLVGHYGNHSTSTLISQSRSSMPMSNRASVLQPSRTSIVSARGSVASSRRNSRGSGHSRSASLPDVNARNSQSSLTPSARFHRDTQLLDIAEVDVDSETSMANLRFGALMTSRWLSFGRVLFSPAHNEMRLSDEPRVLILDGLGSDWSYYVALSYPAATVYNLGPAPPNGQSAWPGVNQKPPPNHRRINHSAIGDAFPFPKGFFTAVVFRFPIATTDEAYQSCIYECKRVLRPGGYLEVAALDIDLMNMGSRARQALRGLKTRLQQNDKHVSLRNLSDSLVRMVGKRGFEEVQRCIVGVPTAGHISRSTDGSNSSSSSRNSGSGPKRARHRRQENAADKKEFSFADLLEDARANQDGGDEEKNNDEGITKMVAKVGRWWYSTCYERTLLGTDNSIWNDEQLLRECEKQGTSFKMLICYAQKPLQTRRRTISI